ncbi:MAG: conjugative transposon protein TraJ [Chitinophagaceae bacterium]|nr:conjugative transposon protein TraJ [Chitinophagaceae bacterium]
MKLLTIDWNSFHEILKNLYTEFIPMANTLIGAGRAIAGTGAVLYIASRIWRHIANAEPIDFYPLFRPFVLGFILTMYTTFIGFINGGLQPVVASTEALVTAQQEDVNKFREKRKEADAKMIEQKKKLLNDASIWDGSIHTTDEQGNEVVVGGGVFSAGGDLLMSQLQIWIRELMYEILDFLFQAASLAIDTIRTFFLIVMVMIGPISIGISVWDGFKDTLQFWIARYIVIFLWLPIANIFTAILSKIQVLMLTKAIAEMDSTGDIAFTSSDLIYMIFMLIGILGYASVPHVAGFVVQSAGIGSAGSAMKGGAAGAISGASTGASVASAPFKMNRG